MHRLSALFLIVGFVMVPLHVRAAPVPGPAAMNLTQKDVGPFFTLKLSTVLDNAAAARQDYETVAQEVQAGHLLTSEIIYQRIAALAPSTTPRGLVEVMSFVTEFDTAAHARAYYLKNVHQEQALEKNVYTVVHIAALGTQHVASAVALGSGDRYIVTDSIQFYRGPYAVFIADVSKGVSAMATLVTFGHDIDTRIQHAQ